MSLTKPPPEKIAEIAGRASQADRRRRARASPRLSLRWKYFAVLLLALALVQGFLGYQSYRGLLDQNESNVKERLSGFKNILLALLINSTDELAPLAAQIAAATAGDEPFPADALPERVSPELLANIESVEFFTSSGRRQWAWSAKNDHSLTPTSLAKYALQTVRTKHRPYGFLDCEKECLQYAYVPTLDRRGSQIIVAISRPVAEVLLQFRQLTGADVALLRSASDDGVTASQFWGRELLAVTDAPSLMPKLQLVAKQPAREFIEGEPQRAGAAKFRMLFRLDRLAAC